MGKQGQLPWQNLHNCQGKMSGQSEWYWSGQDDYSDLNVFCPGYWVLRTARLSKVWEAYENLSEGIESTKRPGEVLFYIILHLGGHLWVQRHRERVQSSADHLCQVWHHHQQVRHRDKPQELSPRKIESI